MSDTRNRTAYGIHDNRLRRFVTGKTNKYLSPPNERSAKLGKALKIIKQEKHLSNEGILCGLCGSGTISEIQNGYVGATDEFFKLTMEHIGMSFGDLLRKAGMLEPYTPVQPKTETPAQSVDEKKLTDEERKYLHGLVLRFVKDSIKDCAQRGVLLDPKAYGMMMHIMEVLEQ